MAFDKGNSNRELADVDDAVYAHARSPNQSIEDDGEQGKITRSAFRTRPASRPRSFLHILEDFQEENSQVTPSPSTSHFTAETDESTDVMPSPLHSNLFPSSGSSATSASAAATTTPLPTSSARRIEDTTRRQQRFSLPIVGLQTTPVTTRANAKGEGLAKRFSLVLGGRTIRGPKSTRVHGPGMDQEAGEGTVKQNGSMGHGVAASRLADLLGRRKGA